MDRQDLPIRAEAPDMPGRDTEIRLPERTAGHDARGAREAGA